MSFHQAPLPRAARTSARIPQNGFKLDSSFAPLPRAARTSARAPQSIGPVPAGPCAAPSSGQDLRARRNPGSAVAGSSRAPLPRAARTSARSSLKIASSISSRRRRSLERPGPPRASGTNSVTGPVPWRRSLERPGPPRAWGDHDLSSLAVAPLPRAARTSARTVEVAILNAVLAAPLPRAARTSARPKARPPAHLPRRAPLPRAARTSARDSDFTRHIEGNTRRSLERPGPPRARSFSGGVT